VKTYDGRGNLLTETKGVLTSDGKFINAQTNYRNDQPISQTIVTSDLKTGAVKTERVLGGKILPQSETVTRGREVPLEYFRQRASRPGAPAKELGSR